MQMRKLNIGLFIAAAILGSQFSITSQASSHRANGDVKFTVRVENISGKDGQTAFDGSHWPFALSPGIWVAHDKEVTLFKEGKAASKGLEMQAEDGNPEGLVKMLEAQNHAGHGVFNTPVGADGPGPIGPGGAYEFTVTAKVGMKLTVAMMFGQSNDWFYAPEKGVDLFKNGRTAMVALPDAFFTPLQGGVPIEYEGKIVGGIGVSGAASAQQDEELAIAGANAFKTMAMNPEMPGMSVTYFEKEKVAAAFVKGAVLFDASDKYMVHASHRDQAGMAEVHSRDADIIYVLEGTAVFVTGGTVVEPKSIAADEIRGKEIAGGETRHLSKGDVIIVPAGTPHWFKEVTAPFNYYVVKAR